MKSDRELLALLSQSVAVHEATGDADAKRLHEIWAECTAEELDRLTALARQQTEAHLERIRALARDAAERKKGKGTK
jgi:hypothetical protein